MDDVRPRKVKAKITRVVTEIAFVYLDRHGSVEEYEECVEEIDSEVIDIHEIRTVLSIHP